LASSHTGKGKKPTALTARLTICRNLPNIGCIVAWFWS